MSENNLTSASGIPNPDNQSSLTAGQNGPVLLSDFHLVEKLAHFNRERIPERVVHAKGAGAYGYFEVTNAVSQWTKANFLDEVGKRTEIFARFSTVGGEKGSADTARDPRGFAVKFYTEEGNYDIVGNNTPVFFIRDPMKFPDLVHSQKRNAGSNLKDHDAFWDFLSLSPESTHQVTILFSDRGTPRNYRQMHGFSSHTFKWVNTGGEAFWVKYHFKTVQGIENFTASEADRLAGEDPDYATRDLYDSIAAGQETAWKVSVQVMPEAEAATYRYDAFDLTKVWPFSDYPLIPVGRMVLNRNPRNFFAETEQAAFTPANLVPGIETSPDRMLQGRIFAYGDAHRYRVGANHQLLPVNYPKNSQPNNYQRDGGMRFDSNGNDAPNYEPNSAGGPEQASQYREAPYQVGGTVERVRHNHPNSDFEQAGMLYRKVMTEEERARLVSNIVGHMQTVSRPEIQERQIWNFYRADNEYGTRVAEGLGLNIEAIVSKQNGLLSQVALKS